MPTNKVGGGLPNANYLVINPIRTDSYWLEQRRIIVNMSSTWITHIILIHSMV